MRNSIKHEFIKMMLRREFWFLVIASIIYAGIAYIGKLPNYGWQDKYIMISATQASMLWHSSAGYVYVLCLLPLFSSIAFSDQYYRECSDNIVGIILTRQKHKHYYYGKLIVTMISGFIFAVLPLLLNLVLCLIAFPIKPTTPVETGSIYATSLSKEIQWVLFPKLYMNYPIIDTLIHILLSGLLGSNIAVLSYAITLHYRKNIIVAICTTTIIYLTYTICTSTLNLYQYTPYHFLLTAPEGYGKNISGYAVIMIVIALSSFVLIKMKLLYTKEVIA